jgi:ankyrin repeat protein
MSYIYKEAEQVVIWLGQGTEETDLIMDSMKRLQENYVRVEGDWRRSAQLWMREPGPGGITRDHDARWRKGMELILMRPWFQRIWILQEIAHARVATVICGNKSVSARTFAQVPSIIGLKPGPHCQAILDIMPGLSREESWWRQTQNLYTLLVKFRESKATDERDIIYALLGISSDAFWSDILFPDYGKSLQQVIRDTTSFLLGHANQDNSLYKFLDWTLPEFLQSLDSLSSAVLGSASENGQEVIAKLLLATDGVDVDLKNNDGWTPLQLATRNGHEAVVKLLLEKGAELESKDNYGQTPLSYATKNGHEAVVKLLLEKGTELESKDNGGRTPLSWAVVNGHKAVVRLLEKGAKLESKDNYGRTPLSYAVVSGHDAVVKLLLEKGTELESKDKGGRTPLSYATQNGHEAVVRLLLEKGAELEFKDKGGRTPLSYATQNGHEAVVKLLLEKGTKLESKDNGGRTPLSWAAQNGHEAVVKLLLEKGAELESKDNYGQTPLSYAVVNGHEAVVNLLKLKTQ